VCLTTADTRSASLFWEASGTLGRVTFPLAGVGLRCIPSYRQRGWLLVAAGAQPPSLCWGPTGALGQVAFLHTGVGLRSIQLSATGLAFEAPAHNAYRFLGDDRGTRERGFSALLPLRRRPNAAGLDRAELAVSGCGHER